MSSTIQVRVDADLFEAAKSAGAVAGRSAAQQIRHWARIGREFELGSSEDQIRAQYRAAKLADDGERVSLGELRSELADVRAVDAAWEDAQDVAAFDVAVAEEGENIPWAQVKADLGWT